MTKADANKYHQGVLTKILRMCEANGIDFDTLDDATIGMHSYAVEGLMGFMNPRDIFSRVEHYDPKEYAKAETKGTLNNLKPTQVIYHPAIKSGITTEQLAKLGARYRGLKLIRPVFS